MRKFLFRSLIFCVILFFIILFGLLMPTTPRIAQSPIYAKIQKDSLLKNTPSPRIIFIGGSNLSFGLNSQLIKDSLHLNPVNTAIMHSIGLQYMLDNTLKYIREDDIIVIAPEYQHFLGTVAYGRESLLYTVGVGNIFDLSELSYNQIKNISPYFLKFSFSKYNPREYMLYSKPEFFNSASFNKYGDEIDHYKFKKKSFNPSKGYGAPYNSNTIELLKDFRKEVENKKATLYVTFPGFQATSFDNNLEVIQRIETDLEKNNFNLLGRAERYRIPDSLMFDSPYHLIKSGVDYRTQLMIHDLKKELNR